MFASTLRNEHGWDVALSCPNCGFEGKPAFQGWTPTREVNFGKTPTIFANLSCPQCSANLRNSAVLKLPELFAEVRAPRSNKLATIYFVAAILFLGLGA